MSMLLVNVIYAVNILRPDVISIDNRVMSTVKHVVAIMSRSIFPFSGATWYSDITVIMSISSTNCTASMSLAYRRNRKLSRIR